MQTKPFYKKTWFIVIASLFVLSLLGGLFKQETATAKKEEKLTIEQIGYFWNKDIGLRYKTFYISSDNGTLGDSLSSSFLSQIKAHGSSQQQTPGKVTASFYYTNKEGTPDVTMARSGEEANATIHRKKPRVAVWKLPSGDINLIENPE